MHIMYKSSISQIDNEFDLALTFGAEFENEEPIVLGYRLSSKLGLTEFKKELHSVIENFCECFRNCVEDPTMMDSKHSMSVDDLEKLRSALNNFKLSVISYYQNLKKAS